MLLDLALIGAGFLAGVWVGFGVASLRQMMRSYAHSTRDE